MADTLIERVWTWLHATFPERQIYIRSDGRVQFFTFGATLQATMAGLSLIFLGWVAFASVNVIFKDRIIAAKDRHYQTMQTTYENRVADQQMSYDELNTALVSAEDRFKSVADELQNKQQTVDKLLSRNQMVDNTLQSLQAKSVGPSSGNSASTDGDISVAPNAAAGSDSDEGDVSVSGGNSQLNVMPQPAKAQQRTAKPVKASFLDETVGRLAGAFFHAQAAPQTQPQISPAVARNPAFRVLAAQTLRIQRMGAEETALLVGVDQQVAHHVDMLEALIKRVGMDPNTFEQHEAMGGPEIPIDDVHIDGISDQKFAAAYTSAGAHAAELDTLFAGLRHVPLTTPVHGQQFEITSTFGGRIDPINHRLSFHPGIDFAGPWGSPIAATAPGVVVFAGPRGGYGNMVEIDHGYGIHTRYGHMSSILVQVGSRVSKGSLIGKLGSTGHSTGPHVHYEVWLADVVRDPSRFIEAGRHVLQ